jgi:hypothetical protein
MLIIHGDHEPNSRAEFVSLRKSAVNAQELDGGKISLPELLSYTSAQSFFGPPDIFITNFFSRKVGSLKQDLVEFFISHQDLPITFYETKDVSRELKGFATANIKKFPLPQTIFTFLDTLDISSLHLALKSTPPEAILVLLAGQLHKLLLFSLGETSVFASWQVPRLKSLLAKFDSAKITKTQKCLLDIDYQHKTGQLPTSLSTALELLILSL